MIAVSSIFNHAAVTYHYNEKTYSCTNNVDDGLVHLWGCCFLGFFVLVVVVDVVVDVVVMHREFKKA